MSIRRKSNPRARVMVPPRRKRRKATREEVIKRRRMVTRPWMQEEGDAVLQRSLMQNPIAIDTVLPHIKNSSLDEPPAQRSHPCEVVIG